MACAFGGFQIYQWVSGSGAPTPAPLQTTSVKRGNIVATVSTTGSVVSQHSSTLTFRSSGRVTEVNVYPGAAVTKGQVLAKIDPVDLQIQLDTAKASLRSAQIKLNTITDGGRSEDVASAESQVAQAEAKLASMTSGGRQEDIVSAQASLESAQAKLALADKPYTDSEIQAQEATVSQAQTSLKNVQNELLKLQQPDASEVRKAEIAVESARNSLNQTYINRDLTCSQRGKDSAECKAARAGSAASESSVKTAEENLRALKAGGTASEIAVAQASVQSAETQLASARIKLEEMKVGAKPEDLTQARAAVAQAEMALELKRSPYTASEVAQQAAAVTQAQQSLALKAKPYTARDLEAAEVTVDTAQAAVNQAQFNLENAVLTAPFDGMVSTVGYSVGTLSSSGGTVGAAAITLVDTNNLRLDVNVDEVDVAKLSIGQTASVTFDALSGTSVEAKVVAISPEATVSSGVVTYKASLTLDKAQGLMVGMSGTAKIITSQRNNVLLVPTKTIKTQGQNKLVELVVAAGKTETRPVRVGMADDQSTEVVSGLQEGDIVVVPGATTSTTTTQGGAGGLGGIMGTMGGGPPPR
jgi:HlyD family secretion protein